MDQRRACGIAKKGGVSTPPNFFYFSLKKVLTLETKRCILLVDVSNDANAKRTEDKMESINGNAINNSTAPRYYTVEGDTYVAQAQWEETNATTLAQAKRIARRRQRFYGTTLRVAERTGGMGYVVRSIAWADPINMAQKSEWQDC